MAVDAKGKKRKSSEKAIDAKRSKQESNSTSKRALKQERQAHRKHADVVNDAKRIWNQLRLKTNTKEQNREYMDELIPLIKGKSNEIALQHDAARVVQAAIQFGTAEERRNIVAELCEKPGNFAELSKSQYAHFCVLKAIKHCHTDKESVKFMTKSLRGHIPKLAVHAVASRVLQSMFTSFSTREMAVLKQEFYGPHFALFTADVEKEKSVSLEANLAKKPDKKETTLEFVRNLVDKGMEKSLYGFTYFQDLCNEYCTAADPKEIRSLAATAADHAIHLLSSRNGSRVAAQLVAYGTAKDRKRIMKSLKGYTKSGLLHQDAYIAIIRLVQLTDDTVSIYKNTFNELLVETEADQPSPLLELALSGTGSKLLLFLLDDKQEVSSAFDPYERSVLFPNPKISEGGESVPTSKKDPLARKNELLKYLREPLIKMCSENCDQLLMSRPGAKMLREAFSRYKSDSIARGVVSVCEVAIGASGPAEGIPNIFDDRDGHLAIKNLLLLETQKGSEAIIGKMFLNHLKDRLMEIAGTSRGAFVVQALCRIPAVSKEALSVLDKKTLKQLKNGDGATAGFEALLKDLN